MGFSVHCCLELGLQSPLASLREYHGTLSSSLFWVCGHALVVNGDIFWSPFCILFMLLFKVARVKPILVQKLLKSIFWFYLTLWTGYLGYAVGLILLPN